MAQDGEVLAPAHPLTGRNKPEPWLQRAGWAMVTVRILPEREPRTAGTDDSSLDWGIGLRRSSGGSVKIQDVLRGKGTQVVTISPEATVTELLALLAEHNVGALVVSADGSSVAGIVSERDVVRLMNGTPDAKDVRVSA